MIVVADYDPQWPVRSSGCGRSIPGRGPLLGAAGLPETEQASIAASQMPAHDDLPG